MNRNCIGEIRELTGEELTFVSGGATAGELGQFLGHVVGGVAGALIEAGGLVADVALTVTGHSS